MNGALPSGLELGSNYSVRFVALDATDGSAMAGVAIGNAAIQVNNLSDSSLSDLETGAWFLVPEKGP